MRIALLTDIYTPMINGVVNHVLMLRSGLEALGHDVWVVSPGAAAQTDDERVLRYGGVPLGATGFFAGWPLHEELWRMLRTADVLHTHHPFLSGALALTARRLRGAPLLFTNHTRYDIYSRVYVPYVPPFLSDAPMYAWLRSMCDQCAAVVAPSQGVADVMQGWGIRRSITVVPNGIQVQRFRGAEPIELAPLGIPSDAVVAVYLGRASREKNMQALLDAFSVVSGRNQQAHLLMIGDGMQLGELKAIVRDRGQDERVHFAGTVPYDEVPRWLAACHFFVSASTSEVHPLVFVEAAAAGLPALGVRSPGVSDTIIDGVTGLLSADSGAPFAEDFERLAADADLRERMGAAALIHSERYTVQANAEAIATLYEQAVAESAARS